MMYNVVSKRGTASMTEQVENQGREERTIGMGEWFFPLTGQPIPLIYSSSEWSTIFEWNIETLGKISISMMHYSGTWLEELPGLVVTPFKREYFALNDQAALERKYEKYLLQPDVLLDDLIGVNPTPSLQARVLGDDGTFTGNFLTEEGEPATLETGWTDNNHMNPFNRIVLFVPEGPITDANFQMRLIWL